MTRFMINDIFLISNTEYPTMLCKVNFEPLEFSLISPQYIDGNKKCLYKNDTELNLEFNDQLPIYVPYNPATSMGYSGVQFAVSSKSGSYDHISDKGFNLRNFRTDETILSINRPVVVTLFVSKLEMSKII